MRAFSLFEPEAYLVQLSRLRAKARERRQPGPTSEGVSLAELSGADRELAAVLAQEVRHGGYRLAPLKRSEVVLDGKRRVIHRPELLDSLVLGAVALRLTELLEGVLLDTVHAYRPGQSSFGVIERFRRYLDEQRRALPKKERGLLVLQRDLSAYGESIPTHAGSKLWPLLESTLQRLDDADERKVMRALIEAGCRAELLLPDGRRTRREVGIPTGSPIQQPLENLYLSPLDEALRSHAGFHARFGDDVFFATPRPSDAAAVDRVLEKTVAELELKFNRQKSRNWYFTKPGRPFAAAAALPFEPTSHIEYLGVRLNFDGRRGLTRKRLRQLLARSRWRIENCVRLAPKEQARELVARALNRALSERGGVADPLVVALGSWVDDRDQLRQIDRELGQRCAEALSGRRGVRAFRHTRVAELRAAGLSSLLELRRRRRHP